MEPLSEYGLGVQIQKEVMSPFWSMRTSVCQKRYGSPYDWSRERDICKPVLKLRILPRISKWSPSQNLDSEKNLSCPQISEDMTENLRRGWVKLFQVYCSCIYFIYVCAVPSNRVISSPFSHKTFFSQKYTKVPHIFLLVENSLKKWFRCWHGHIWPWLTSKTQFCIVLQVTKLPSWRVISSSPYTPALKHKFKPLQVI